MKLATNGLPPITIEWKEVQERFEKLIIRDKKWPGVIQFSGNEKNNEAYDQARKRFFEERLFLDEENILHVRFRYDYGIDLKRIPTPISLVRWIHHLSGKTWMLTGENEFIQAFIEKVCEIKKWRLYGCD